MGLEIWFWAYIHSAIVESTRRGRELREAAKRVIREPWRPDIDADIDGDIVMNDSYKNPK